MTGISAASGAGGALGVAKFQAEYAAKVAVLQKDAVEQQGDMALKLIQSAGSAAPRPGGSLDISG